MAVAAVLAVAVALLGYQVLTGLPVASRQAGAGPTLPPDPSSSVSARTPAGLNLPVRAVSAFDPLGDGSEHDDRASLASDGDRTTTWTTQEYYNDPFGGLKDGVGLLVDLGAVRSVGAVSLDLVGAGSDVELRTAGTAGDEAPTTLDSFRAVAAAESVEGLTTLSTARPVPARWLLVWFTDLPEVGPAQYRGGIAELSVRS